LLNADAIYLSNALRGLLRVELTAKEREELEPPTDANGHE